MVTDLLTGLRIGGALLWLLLWWRIIFESWGITARDEVTRKRGWRYYRAGLLVMCFTLVCLATPANLLRVHGHISEATEKGMMVAVAFCAAVAGGLFLRAMDIATGQDAGGWRLYSGLPILSIAYVLGSRGF